MPGSSKGTGGHGRRKLTGKGPTPKAEMRPGHPARRKAARAARRDEPAPAPGSAAPTRSSRRSGEVAEELVIGRNSVVEALRARVPGIALLRALGTENDPRTVEAAKLAERRGVPIADVTRSELDRRTAGAPHQGVALVVPPYDYAHPEDLLAGVPSTEKPLLVALDGITDPRNLGSVVRSAAALGAHGVLVPERRAAGVTAGAWKSSAGALARLRVARATNLVRALQAYRADGLFVVGLAADGEIDTDDLALARDPLVLVIGSEGKGLSRLVGEQCDLRMRIPITGAVESLNAGVAAGIALAEVARRRR
ncbi:MAG TPA: 23S rRNA (guanosine(2251)-2'-O)-methyltransferase RlmB [Frankiaceae bacterium]|nr:23S rRNA (guanosine(2251)-2'-O)-methyltransferase RlmB [Frankiaceae bacterium]